jgi:hypothetical protein
MTTTVPGVPTNYAHTPHRPHLTTAGDEYRTWITSGRHAHQTDRHSAITATTPAPTIGSTETNSPGETSEVEAPTTNRSGRRQYRGQNFDHTPHIRAGVEGVAQ